MLSDIETAVQNHDEMTSSVRKLNDNITELSKERSHFMLAQDKIRGQIKDFENFLNETRGVHNREMVDLKK